jgi:hypothetical protein
MLDNEISMDYREAIKKRGITVELVPPTNHRQNLAERAIQTAKGHIIANIIGCDESFPIREWYRLLPQIETTLNMLRPANVRDTISAHLYVYGLHDYNREPLAPLGCKTQCFADPERRTSFGAHSMDSWYIGTSKQHYRCYKVFMKDTRAERVTDTAVFQHRHVTNPTVSMADKITSAAHELTTAIQSNMHKQVENVEMKELERLANIFQEAAQKVAEGDARTPRVPTKHATSPRVSTAPNKELERQDAPTPRVDSAGTPRYNTRQQKRVYGTPLTDAILTVMELSGITACP